MAKTKIVNEIPDELEMEGEEVEVKTTEAEKADCNSKRHPNT